MLGVQEILNRLDAPRRTGADRWMARCPAHDDQTPSLSVKNGEGNILLNCFAGCDFEDVVRALGLEKSDLYHDNGASGSGSREVIDTYDYTNEDGDPLYRVVRTCPPKGFYQQRWNGSGGWANGLGDTRRVLFRLPEVIEAIALEKLIHVVEGEKDVHAVEHAGGIATCNPMGAGNWRDEYSEILRGARVRVIADDDESGIKRAHAVAKSLHGFAELVEILQAAKGKDASDHCEAGFGLDDFVPLTDETSPDEPGEPGPKLYPLVSDLEAEDLPAPEWGSTTSIPTVASSSCLGREASARPYSRSGGRSATPPGWSSAGHSPAPPYSHLFPPASPDRTIGVWERRSQARLAAQARTLRQAFPDSPWHSPPESPVAAWVARLCL